MGKIDIPNIGKIGSIKDVSIEILTKMSQGVISGAILDNAEKVVYSLRVEGEERVRRAKFDGEWARKTTERYAGSILSDPRTLITLDKKSFGSVYFRQKNQDTEAYYEIKRWKDDITEVEESPETET